MSACQYLKDVTAEHHRRTERVLINRMLFSSALTPASYAVCLGSYLGLIGPLEQLLAIYPELLDCGYTKRAHLLREDLLALGWAQQQLDTIAQCHKLPTVSTLSAALGSAYVLQGSRSGGVVIRRRVLTLLGPDEFRSGGVKFWGEMDNVETIRLWQEFKVNIDSRFTSYHNLSLEQAATAAIQTFEAFQYWLNLPIASVTDCSLTDCSVTD